ncbi:tyrosine-type recombinase/integrase [Sphingomonas corticis]|uniref:Site-specific integrase n=1 Tax=Sphingomonas corticis TaxID=2722791 RepID=A0ABX1CTZ4_9SPHN|nr:site-specific integrase [Sphingomonas corticis]NJR80276.1 site-specific integrase [Sphingomonas corticis]
MELVIEHFDLDESVPEPNVDRVAAAGRRPALPTGFPFLFDVESAEVIEPVLLYARAKFTSANCWSEGRWTKRNSAEAAISDLKDWWYKLDAREIPWDVADDDLVAEWLIDQRTLISGRTNNFLASSTVKRRAASVSEFYRWALDEGLVERAPTALASTRLAKLKFAASRRRTKPPEWQRFEADPHPIAGKYLPAFERGMGKLPSDMGEKWTPDPEVKDSVWRKEPDGKLMTSRDRLAMELALSCGMRIDEILNLDSATFKDFTCTPEEGFKLFELRITHTKGLVPREVFIPYWLMSEIAEYIAKERSVALAEARRIWAKGRHATSLPWQLLVNPPGSGRHVGKRANAEPIEQRFAETCLGIEELRRSKTIAKGTPDAAVAIGPRHTFHDFRHTFAVMTYHALEDIGIPRPWIRIQKLLGHASVSTTVGTYLKVLDAFGAETLDRLGQAYRAMRDRWVAEDRREETIH